MTQQAQTPSAPQAPAVNGQGVVVPAAEEQQHDSFESRYAALQQEIRQEQAEGFTAPRADEAAPAPQGQPAAEPSAEQRAADRRARLAKLQHQEQERVDAQARRVHSTQIAQQLEAERAARQELEAALNQRIERTALRDPLAALRLLEEEGVPADKLAEAIRTRLTDPEAAAAHAAQRAVDPKLSALERKLAEQERVIAEFVSEQQRRETEAMENRQINQFLGAVEQAGGFAAKFLAAEGPEKFMGLVNRAVARLPEGAGPNALLDQVEEILETDGRRVYEQLASIYGPLGSATSNVTTPPTRAAAKATTTVTNSIAQERASVVTDANPLDGLSFDERVEYLKRHGGF